MPHIDHSKEGLGRPDASQFLGEVPGGDAVLIGRTQNSLISLRISITDLCQLRCLYCMPPGGAPKQGRSHLLRFEEILRFVRSVKRHFGLSKVHITGGEPLVRRGVTDFIAMLHQEGLDDLALTTNGQRLAQRARTLRRAGLSRVNVSLDTLDENTYSALTRGGDLRAVLDGIESARREGFSPIKINTVVLRGHNDGDVVRLAQWAIRRGCCIRFLELMPIGCVKRRFRDLFVPASEVRIRLERYFALAPLPHRRGDSSRTFLASDADGRRGVIGFIAPETQPFCAECTRLRLTSTGRLISCLARGEGSSIGEILRSEASDADEALRREVERALGRKRGGAAFSTNRAMVTVGG